MHFHIDLDLHGVRHTVAGLEPRRELWRREQQCAPKVAPSSETSLGKVLADAVSELNSLNSPSVIWDGKNNNGEYIGSGIYLVVVSHPEKGNSVSKIAVIR